jgi:eukaryotic-like serine/threonine-protein kinase
LSNTHFRYLHDSVFERPTDWSRDGRFLLYESDRNAGRHLMVLPLQGGAPIPIAQTPAAEGKGRFSPDGRWIAYQSDELRERNEVFVQAFPGSRESRRQVSVDGGTSPVWRGDGREIYFMSPDFHLMIAAVTFSENGQAVQLGTPAPLFPAALPAGSEFEVANDGQRFLINRPAGPADAAPISVLSNWTRAK